MLGLIDQDALAFLWVTDFPLFEEESEEAAARPLTTAEKAALTAWIWTFEAKYEIVGTYAPDAQARP